MRLWDSLTTGADASVTAKQLWPRRWPLKDSAVPIRGVGQAHSPQLSTSFLNWSMAEGHQGTFQPFVLDIDLNLWGRDVLTDMGVPTWASHTLRRTFTIQAYYCRLPRLLFHHPISPAGL